MLSSQTRTLNCQVQRDRFGSVILLGAINEGFRSELVNIDGALTARRYNDKVRNPVLLPLLRRQPQNLIFQHDYARPHFARETQDFPRQSGVNVMDWPAVSPNLNLIEHILDELGRWVH